MAKETSNPQPADDAAASEVSDQGTKVSLKKSGQPNTKDEWKKVEAIVAAAQSAYAGGTPLSDVLQTIIETLSALKDEVDGSGDLGGLGTSGPQMNIDRSQDTVPVEGQ